MLKRVLIVLVLLLAPSLCAAEEGTATASVHAGFLYPNGVDLAGYTVEQSIADNVYYFYTFGFPSLAAVGLSYYADYEGNGLSGTVGVGIGSVLYASLVYQWKIANKQYLKTGAGFATGVAYTGAYPALSYEYRF